jgi:hypothetical protein
MNFHCYKQGSHPPETLAGPDVPKTVGLGQAQLPHLHYSTLNFETSCNKAAMLSRFLLLIPLTWFIASFI